LFVVPVASAMAVMIFADFAGTQTHPTQVHREQSYSFGRRHHFKKPCRHMAKPEMHPDPHVRLKPPDIAAEALATTQPVKVERESSLGMMARPDRIGSTPFS